ncbi:MAG: hypothetical protein ACRDSZ_22665 [Pseudonocardiaceae bacterium]
MTVKLGISLSDQTHAAIAAAAKAEGLPLSTFVDRVLAREIFRRGVDDHNDMLHEAALPIPTASAPGSMLASSPSVSGGRLTAMPRAALSEAGGGLSLHGG